MRLTVARLGVLLVAAACAGGSSQAPEAQTPAPRMSVLARSAVPAVPSPTIDLPATELAKDAAIPDLASKLTGWGYRDGRQRTFQGESRHLSLVVSRSLAFDDHTGAEAFAAFVRANAAAYFGTGVTVHRLVAGDGSGSRFVPPPCPCHMANPEEVGVTVDGSTVTWLEINGPDATKPELIRLLDPRLAVAVP